MEEEQEKVVAVPGQVEKITKMPGIWIHLSGLGCSNVWKTTQIFSLVLPRSWWELLLV